MNYRMIPVFNSIDEWEWHLMKWDGSKWNTILIGTYAEIYSKFEELTKEEDQ